MGKVSLHLVLSPAMAKDLDRLGEKLGLDRTNTIRHAIARLKEFEALVVPRAERELERGKGLK